MDSPKMITLMSSDGEIFELEESVAVVSPPIKHMIEVECGDTIIPLLNVNSKILTKVFDYCKKHVESPNPEDEIQSWDAEFVKVDHVTLYDLILAADYLKIKSLLDLICQTVADMIKRNPPEQICERFNIENDFTPEEEEEVRRQHPWAFE